MPKHYDLSKKSDLNRLSKDIVQAATDMANDKIRNGLEFDYECPNCHNQIKIHVGKVVCPLCGSEINVKFNQ